MRGKYTNLCLSSKRYDGENLILEQTVRQEVASSHRFNFDEYLRRLAEMRERMREQRTPLWFLWVG